MGSKPATPTTQTTQWPEDSIADSFKTKYYVVMSERGISALPEALPIVSAPPVRIGYTAPVGIAAILAGFLSLWAIDAFSQVGFSFWSIVISAASTVYWLTAVCLLLQPQDSTRNRNVAVFRSYIFGVGAIQSLVFAGLGVIVLGGGLMIEPSVECFIWGLILIGVFVPSARALLRRVR